jgi:DNA-binding NarL/FixJ family response regulator
MITTYRPDVVLMDVVMPGMNGIDAAQAVQSVPGVRILMLSLCGDEEYVVRALRAGAIGYLLKDSVSADLIPALQAAARGEYYFSIPIQRDMIVALVRGSPL